jgi:2-iminobutanoate/2-iminopropanoate deaminase
MRASILLCGAGVAVVMALPLVAGDGQRTYIPHVTPPGAPPLPFSDAVRSGDTLYVGGHLGIDPQTGNAAADPATEARLVMDAVKHTVEAAGLQMDDLVSVTVFCTDLTMYERFNAIYQSYFHGRFPARAFIGAHKLVRGAHFEVLGIAVKAPHAKPG